MSPTRRAFQMTFLLPVSLSVTLLLPATGCSLIGLGIGVMEDAASDGFDKKRPMEMRTEEPGQRVIVIRTRGDSTAGTFLGMAPHLSEQYANAFAPIDSGSSESSHLPALGDTVKIISLKDGVSSVARGSFSRIEPDHMYVRSAPPVGEVGVPTLDIVNVINADRSIVRGDTLRVIMQHVTFPTLTIATKSDTLLIPTEDIEMVLVPSRVSGALEGLLIGGMIDIAVIAVIAVSSNFTFQVGPPAGSY